MTNSVDNLTKRINALGEGQENTLGVAREGFNDATGEYPNRDYFFAPSINKAAKGEVTNNLYRSGGDFGVSIDFPDQAPSQFPHNQIQQTPAGHSWEIDDTPGGERILVKHKSGAGIELRADGSVLFSSVNKKVEVTGGDHTVIVEGEGNLVYKGNLNVKVTGDYNLEVEGNINVTTAGTKTDTILGNHIKTVDKNQNYEIKGSRSASVVGVSTETLLNDYNVMVKMNQTNHVEGNVETTSGNEMVMTAIKAWTASSTTSSLSGMHISVMGVKGMLGGQLVDHYGKTYSGPPGGDGNGGTTYYGTLIGKATEAITSDFANKAGWAKQSDHAKKSSRNGDGNKGSYPTKMPYVETASTIDMPTTEIVVPYLSTSNYAIRNVQVDTDISDPNSLIAKILKSDDYDNLFTHDPTIHEIRSKIRDIVNFKRQKFVGHLVSAGMLSPQFAQIAPPAIGRAAGKAPSVIYGTQPIGNNPADNRSKRFKPE